MVKQDGRGRTLTFVHWMVGSGASCVSALQAIETERRLDTSHGLLGAGAVAASDQATLFGVGSPRERSTTAMTDIPFRPLYSRPHKVHHQP